MIETDDAKSVVGNKFVIIFASHPDKYFVKQYLSVFSQFRDFNSEN
jgi:hypothetical protein